MKKVISALTAATMVASMSATMFSAVAYSEGDITFYLKADAENLYTITRSEDDTQTVSVAPANTNFTVSEDGKTITFASAADAANAQFSVGAYIDMSTENPTIQKVGGMVIASSDKIHFSKSGVDLKKAPEGATEKEYAYAGGTFTTNLFPNTFAYVTSRGSKYTSTCGAMTYVHSDEWGSSHLEKTEEFGWDWTFNFTGNDAKFAQEVGATFLGAKSDDFALTEFTVTLDESITDGTYTIDYDTSYVHPEYGDTITTFLSDGKTSITPANLESLKIVVGSGETQPTESETEPSSEVTEPSSEETQPTETEPTEVTETLDTQPTEPVSHDSWEWDIDDVEYTPVDVSQDIIEVPIYVYNDKGINAFQIKMLVDGKSMDDPDCPFEVYQIEDPLDAYTDFDMFVPNVAEGSVGASNSNDKDLVAKNGGKVAVYQFIPKAGVEYTPGTVYKLTFDASGDALHDYLYIADSNKTNFVDQITFTPGSITIPGGEPTEPSSEATEPSSEDQPTEPSSEATEPESTEPSSEATEPSSEDQPTEPSSEATEPQPGDLLYGDVNKNGKVELVDIVMLNRFLTKYDNQELDAYQMEVADCAGNATPNVQDATADSLNGSDSVEILKYLIGLVASLPSQG